MGRTARWARRPRSRPPARQQRHAGAGRHHLRQRRQAGRAEAELLGARAGADRQRLVAQAVAVVEQQHVRARAARRGSPGASASRAGARAATASTNGSRPITSRSRTAEVGLERQQRGVEPARRAARAPGSRSCPRSSARSGGGARGGCAGAAAGSRYGEIVGMTPMQSGPGQRIAQPPGRVDEIVRVDEHPARPSIRLSPAGVGSTRRRSRSNRRTPSAPSSWRELRGQRRLRHAARSAARRKLRVSATATAYWSWRRETGGA